MILWKLFISFRNTLSGILFNKQKDTRFFQWQENIVDAIIAFWSCRTMSQFFLKFQSLAEIFWGAFVDERQLMTKGVPKYTLYLFYLLKLVHFFKFSFRIKRVLSFVLLDECNLIILKGWESFLKIQTNMAKQS